MKKFLPVFFMLALLGFGCASPVDTTDRSDSTDTASVSEQTEPVREVVFEKLYEDQVDAPLWLFGVADDEGQVVLSAERNQGIDMAFFDPEDPEATLDWKTIVSRDEVGGVADHWHVFAGGYHYLVFSQPSADSAYAVKVDRDLNRMAMEHIIDRYEVPASERPPMGGEFLVTNDMFLVPEEDGIAAAFFLPTIGHKVFRMDEDLEVFDTVTIGGGEIVHGNGSSAIQTQDGFDVLAADTIMHLQQSGVTRLRYDKDWELVDTTRLVDEDKQSAGMTSGVYLNDGSLVMHARVNVDAYARGQMPPPPTPGVLTDDGGNIVRYVFNPEGELILTEYLYEGTDAHRPHTALVGDLLITTWDGGGGGTAIRIDRIE
ncbi:MAG: hypothetical protein AAB413_04005 [Patescibacteria group bacterium]